MAGSVSYVNTITDSTWTYISDITNSTLGLNLTLSTFSFQDALTPYTLDAYELNEYTYSPYPYLLRSGCLQDDGTNNCTASCQDVNAIFGSLDTLHNCMVYPTISDLYARNNLSNVSLAEYYNIEKSTPGSSLYTNITNNIKTCLSDYCSITLAGSDCAEGMKDENTTYSPLNINSTFYFYNQTDEDSRFDICAFIPQSFNPDIGGIGVYISYWIQTGLALLSFVLVVWWNWGIYYVCLGALLLPRGYSKAKKAAQRVRNDSRNKHLPSLTGALAEFQKGQCFFMLAINIAALVNRNSGGYQPNSLQQLYNTYILIKSVSISGYLPVTFTLFTLHLVDVVSWYLLVLSVVTVLVSMATLFVIGNFSPTQDDMNYLSQQALSGGPESCGSMNLGVYCYSGQSGGTQDDSTDPASGAYSMLAFCLVVLILLVAHQCHAFKDSSTGKPKPWLSKIISAFFRKCNFSLRKIQFGLALISIGLNSYVLTLSLSTDWSEVGYYESNALPTLGAPKFLLFASCWTLLFVLYLFFTSNTAFTRADRPIGRFFSQKITFAVDFLSVVFWFAGFIALANFYSVLGSCEEEGGAACGTIMTSILVGVCVCITFAASTLLAARHMEHNHGKQYWILQRFNNHQLKRQLSEKIPSWRHLTRKVPSWKQISRKLPLWTKHPLIADTHTRFQRDTLPTIKVNARRAYQDVKTHASKLDWPSAMTSAALFTMYLIFFSLYIYWFNVFIQDLAWFAYNGVDGSSWSFGQVVAIMVWVEPLCEYFHLELRGMQRGFEHRLWGYKVVQIKQPNSSRSSVSSSGSSIPSPSQTPSLDDLEANEFGNLGTVDSSVGDDSAQHGKTLDEENGAYDKLAAGEPTVRQVPVSRESSGEKGERESVGEWQIPETVILTSVSTSPF